MSGQSNPNLEVRKIEKCTYTNKRATANRSMTAGKDLRGAERTLEEVENPEKLSNKIKLFDSKNKAQQGQ